MVELSDSLKMIANKVESILDSYPKMVVEIPELNEKEMCSLNNYFEKIPKKDFSYMIRQQAILPTILDSSTNTKQRTSPL